VRYCTRPRASLPRRFTSSLRTSPLSKRSTPFAFAALTVAAVSLVSVAACSGGSNSSASEGSQNANDNPATSDTSTGGNPNASLGSASSDASAAAPAVRHAVSPLCAYTEGTCFPDDDGASSFDLAAPTCPSSSTDNVKDASTEVDGGDDNVTVTFGACRVEPVGSDATTVKPACETANRQGTDGVSCTSGADCAAGFDCVVGEMGAVCRHYCCSGSCDGRTSKNGGSTFCDLQAIARPGGNQNVPVCVPLKSCKLLADGQCAATETCAVVTDDGVTGCVHVGGAKAGDSCDRDDCAANLTCLGSVGDRRCYQLCHVEGADCASNELCTTAALFQDMSFGVCRSQ
jgi:hypothetical protein